jgi:hypothetical protein
MTTIHPRHLIESSFLKNTEADSYKSVLKLSEQSLSKYLELKHNPKHFKFLCEADGNKVDDMYTYNQILDSFERYNFDFDNDTGYLYYLRRISAHQGPLQTPDRDYKGSTYNVVGKSK